MPLPLLLAALPGILGGIGSGAAGGLASAAASAIPAAVLHSTIGTAAAGATGALGAGAGGALTSAIANAIPAASLPSTIGGGASAAPTTSIFSKLAAGLGSTAMENTTKFLGNLGNIFGNKQQQQPIYHAQFAAPQLMQGGMQRRFGR